MQTETTNGAREITGDLTAQAQHCPEHGHRLLPMHRVAQGARLVVGWTCPEPYCRHVVLDVNMVEGRSESDWRLER